MNINISTIIRISVAAGCMLMLAQCFAVEASAASATKKQMCAAASKSEPDLMRILTDKAKVADDEVTFFDRDDFDHDGNKEAFAVIDGDVWFVSTKECRQLTSSKALGFEEDDRILTLGGTKHILFDEQYVTETLTYAWYVSDQKAVASPISKIGMVIPDPDIEDAFMIRDSSYDAAFDNEAGVFTGHTYKTYYFYNDNKKGRICEYGGTEIDSKKADELCGMSFADRLLTSADKMLDLFYTGNGLVVMNFVRYADDADLYCHYIYDCNKGCFINDMGQETTQDEPLAGTYLKALCPDMAVYPE